MWAVRLLALIATLCGGNNYRNHNQQVMMVSASSFFAIPSRVPGFRYPFQALLAWGDAGGGKSMAEKVLTNPKWPESWPYSKQDFARMDESDDSLFYDQPRLVYHIDDVRIYTKRRLFRFLLGVHNVYIYIYMYICLYIYIYRVLDGFGRKPLTQRG